MNEFRLIDDVMPDIPPSDPGRTAATRARVLNGGRSRRRFGWTAAAVAAVATASVIVSVVVVPRLGAPAGSSASGPRPALDSSPRQALDAAADLMARRSEPASGRYWRATTEITTQVRGSRYSVTDRVRRTLWRGAGRQVMIERRFLGAQPVTPADRAVWEHDGSPKLCEEIHKCSADGSSLFLMPGQTEYLIDHSEMGSLLQHGFLKYSLETAEFMKLPGDPAALRSELLKFWPAYRDDPLLLKKGAIDRMSMDEWLWSVGTGILEEMPTSPATRAALYRMLADIPGARVLSQGHEVTVARPPLYGSFEDRVVIDRATGALSAIRKVLVKTPPSDKSSGGGRSAPPPGTVNHDAYEVTFVKVGWTDDSFQLPGKCATSMKKTGGRCVR
jgi:hypothetical protein